jgi:hypothetical protein
MENCDWFILIYQVTDADTQASLEQHLNAFGGLVTDTEANRGEFYVIVECPGTLAARTIHELVMTHDAQATLVGTHADASATNATPLVQPA